MSKLSLHNTLAVVFLLLIFVVASCFFATKGSGSYTYELSTQDPDSLEVNNYKAEGEPVLPENLEDDYDLLDDYNDSTTVPEDSLLWPE